jgi:signal transduction histidine kinase
MWTEKPGLNKLSVIRRELLSGDSIFGLIIFVIVGIFLANLMVSVWHNVLFQRDVKEKAGVQKLKAVGGMLAKTTECLLAANELSILRRTVAEAGVEQELKSCRVVLPDGGVLADADPSGITVIELPESWQSQSGTYSEKSNRDTVMLSFPLDVPGRGSASLEIAAEVRDRLEAGLEPQTAQMAIACLALASMLLIHRHSRFRLKAISAIQDTLLAVKEGETDISALQLDPSLGLEAVAWNKLLGEKHGQQVRTAIESVKESIGVRCEVFSELAAAYDALPQGLILVGENMHADYANGAAAALLQANRCELTNGQVTQFITDQRVITAIQKAIEDTATERTVVEVEPSGSKADSVLRFTVRPIQREGLSFAMVVIEDITQQRVAEAARNSFIAKAAHELRAPLTNIRLYVENALERCQQDPVNTAKYLGVIGDESGRLERVVSEVLSVSEIEAGSFRLKRDDVRIGALLEQLKTDYEAKAKNKQVKLEFNLPPKLPVLHADRDKIALALQNLVSNAVKYTPEGGQVTVNAAVEKERVTVDVTDTGIGINEQEIEKIFDRFYRAKDERVTEIVGSGLGLAIARDVIRLHGGDISVESEPGKGSTFTLTLPIPEGAV